MAGSKINITGLKLSFALAGFLTTKISAMFGPMASQGVALGWYVEAFQACREAFGMETVCDINVELCG